MLWGLLCVGLCGEKVSITSLRDRQPTLVMFRASWPQLGCVLPCLVSQVLLGAGDVAFVRELLFVVPSQPVRVAPLGECLLRSSPWGTAVPGRVQFRPGLAGRGQ